MPKEPVIQKITISEMYERFVILEAKLDASCLKLKERISAENNVIIKELRFYVKNEVIILIILFILSFITILK